MTVSRFLDILRVDSDAGQIMAEALFKDHDIAHEVGDGYVYAKGTIPILLVAHTDTVHKLAPKEIYVDSNAEVVWSPDGLGADDRAGIYAIDLLLKEGFRPHVLFTDEEETGGFGAQSAAHEMPPPDVHCLIQLDRAGCDHFVSYSCRSKKMVNYLKGHGLNERQGSFSDIAILMPWWEIAGANLAIGYYNQHSDAEFVKLKELRRTVDRVRRMLKQPPRKKIAYVAPPPVKYEHIPLTQQSTISLGQFQLRDTTRNGNARTGKTYDELYNEMAADRAKRDADYAAWLASCDDDPTCIG